MHKSLSRFWCSFWLCLFFSLPWLSGCGLMELKDRALGGLVSFIPTSIEVSLGQQLLPSILPPEQVLDRPAAQQKLTKLLAPLLQTHASDDLPIQLYISKDPSLNAFAIPGGILIFNRGLLLAADKPEEILGVAAHELAHANERHSLRSMIQSIGIYAAISLLLGDVQGIGALLVYQGQMLLQNGFSRAQERQADEKGFEYLVAAGIDPRGMTSFFERIQGKEKEVPGGSVARRSLSLLRSHPLTEERIRTVKERWAALPATEKARLSPPRFDLKELQSQL